jgi:hypothetical protein
MSVSRGKDTSRRSPKSTKRSSWTKAETEKLAALGRYYAEHAQMLPVPTVGLSEHTRDVFERTIAMGRHPEKGKPGRKPDEVLFWAAVSEVMRLPIHPLARWRWPRLPQRQALNRLSALKAKHRKTGCYDALLKEARIWVEQVTR